MHQGSSQLRHMVLEAPVVGGCAAPKPHSDAAGHDVLSSASVEGPDDW